MGISQYPPSSAHTHDDRYYTEAETDTEIDNATPQSDTTALTNDTVSAVGSQEQWGTETVTFSDPGTEVAVLAFLSGWVRNNSSTDDIIVRAKVQVSLDGGSTWTDGEALQVFLTTDGNGGSRSQQLSQTRVSGTPTGDVVVRAQIEQSAFGSAGDGDWRGGRIMAVVHG